MTSSDLLIRFNALPASIRTSKRGQNLRYWINRNALASADAELTILESKVR